MAKKKAYVFSLTRSLTQTAEVTIKADSQEEAEAQFDDKREETNDFEEEEWTNGDPDGPLDWEIEGPPDEE